MSILDKLIETSSNMERDAGMWRPPMDTTLRQSETGKIEPRGFATSREYALSLTITVTYWANRAQIEDARKVAERALISHLYADMLSKVDQLSLAVSDGDGKRAWGICTDLRKMITG